MNSFHSGERLASRVSTATPAEAAPQGESPVIEWLLHDDQVMRECFRHAAVILQHVIPGAKTAVVLLDAEHQHFRAEVGTFMLNSTPRGRSLCDYVVNSGQFFTVENASVDPRFATCTLVHNPPFICFYAGMPLRVPGGDLVGALVAMDTRPREIDAGQREVFHHLGAMIENDLKLRTATAIDPLTRLFNRRFMLENTRQKWRDAADGDWFAAVMIDIDWFKQYNDTYGHQAGDDCLRIVAETIQSVADTHHLVAGRLGGEEFGLIYSGTERPALEAALEQLRADIADRAMTHAGSPLGHVSVSIGAALMRKSHDDPSSAKVQFAQADEALYVAKREGRNTVRFA